MSTVELAVQGGASHDDPPTRARVVEAIVHGGPTTAATLATELDLTPAAIRRHLDHLLADGVIEQREPRANAHRGRGRPAKVFALTDAGRGQLAHAYDDIAIAALSYVRDTLGDEAVRDFAAHRLDGLRARLVERLASVESVDERPAALAEALSAEGFAASTSQTGTGIQMCQHHCPIAHVAEEFGQLCEAEADMFAEILGTHVQRLATIAHGDGVCTTHLPLHPTTIAEKVTSV